MTERDKEYFELTVKLDKTVEEAIELIVKMADNFRMKGDLKGGMVVLHSTLVSSFYKMSSRVIDISLGSMTDDFKKWNVLDEANELFDQYKQFKKDREGTRIEIE